MNPLEGTPIQHSQQADIHTESKIKSEIDPIAKQREKILTGKDVEGIPINSDRLEGRISTSQLQSSTGVAETGEISASIEALEIAKRSGEIWECIGRKLDESGAGFIYQFKLREEFNDIDRSLSYEQQQKRLGRIFEKTDAIFPAIEPSASSSLLHDPKFRREGLIDYFCQGEPDSVDKARMQKQTEGLAKAMYVDELKLLGYEAVYEDGNVFFFLPDQEALLARWEEMRKTRPSLPELHLASGEGIADDLDFVEALISHDALLSTGKEFMHDSYAHVIPTLQLMFDSGVEKNPTYAEEKARLVGVMQKLYDQIQNAKALIAEGSDEKVSDSNLKLIKDHMDEIEFSLGAFTDYVSSISKYTETSYVKEGFQKEFVGEFLRNPRWQCYLERRFPGKELNGTILTQLWNVISSLPICRT